MRRDKYQRQAYALRRMSKAVDRMILATSPAERERLKQWIQAWAIIGGLRKEVTSLYPEYRAQR